VKNQTAVTLRILGILLVFVHISLSAQTTASTGSIQGTVTDPSGEKVERGLLGNLINTSRLPVTDPHVPIWITSG
jgi:hypothetical protein